MQTQTLPYQKNSVALFEQVAHLPFAVFLDGGGSTQTASRYDIISADPLSILENTDDIFSRIQQAVSQLKKKDHPHQPSPLPFTVGAIGYIGYDLARTQEKIPAVAIDDIAIPTTIVGIYNWSIVVDHVAQKTFLTTLNLSVQKKIQTLFKNALTTNCCRKLEC